MKVKIIGAGSIGNHHAQSARAMGWDVVVVDTSMEALERMKYEIYPERYGAWDEEIKLWHPDFPNAKEAPKGNFDIIMIDTPPDVRMKLALEALQEKPKLLHLEKPICAPIPEDLELLEEFLRRWKKECEECKVTVGYNHAVSAGIRTLTELIKRGSLGEALTIDVEFREHWKGIFKAHPWLKGPQDSYLGYLKRGGGAGGEHSHALHLFLYLAKICGWTKSSMANPISSDMDLAGDYDQLIAFQLNYWGDQKFSQ
ncbi:MAG: Gfo/Idh/MocA family oxidoreductase, partial [Patescibacteria group bacterium]